MQPTGQASVAAGSFGSEETMKLQEEALRRGALAGVVAGCFGVKTSQVENMLSILGEYRYPASFDVLLLFLSYQAGRGHIRRDVAREVTRDLLELRRLAEKSVSTAHVAEIMDELLRAYLGALKWTHTAAGKMRRICNELRYLSQKPVGEIVRRLLGA